MNLLSVTLVLISLVALSSARCAGNEVEQGNECRIAFGEKCDPAATTTAPPATTTAPPETTSSPGDSSEATTSGPDPATSEAAEATTQSTTSEETEPTTPAPGGDVGEMGRRKRSTVGNATMCVENASCVTSDGSSLCQCNSGYVDTVSKECERAPNSVMPLSYSVMSMLGSLLVVIVLLV